MSLPAFVLAAKKGGPACYSKQWFLTGVTHAIAIWRETQLTDYQFYCVAYFNRNFMRRKKSSESFSIKMQDISHFITFKCQAVALK